MEPTFVYKVDYSSAAAAAANRRNQQRAEAIAELCDEYISQ
jgi:hypothetical protein